jgi:hypothetical protein
MILVPLMRPSLLLLAGSGSGIFTASALHAFHAAASRTNHRGPENTVTHGDDRTETPAR